ncbi:MAG: ribosomal protein S18-alanine N-acetyltransferase [Endomicrobiia bacterium]
MTDLVLDNLIIEEATLKDLHQIYLIEKENFKFPWDKNFIYFNFQLSKNIRRFYVARLEDIVIGYVVCGLSDRLAHIYNISVKKEYQNKGVGSKLLKYLLDDLILSGIETVILEVRLSNIRAVSFYRKFGFNEFKIKKSFYPDKEDALIMVKNFKK